MNAEAARLREGGGNGFWIGFKAFFVEHGVDVA